MPDIMPQIIFYRGKPPSPKFVVRRGFFRWWVRRAEFKVTVPAGQLGGSRAAGIGKWVYHDEDWYWRRRNAEAVCKILNK